jgi:hypothetical protein
MSLIKIGMALSLFVVLLMSGCTKQPTSPSGHVLEFHGGGENPVTPAQGAGHVLSVGAGGMGGCYAGTIGTVTSTPSGINCAVLGRGGATACSATIADGTAVTLSASSTTPSTTHEWSGACTGNQPTCVVTMNQDITVLAEFCERRAHLQ